MRIILLAFVFIFQTAHATEKVKTMKPTWFTQKECQILEIQKFKSISDQQIISEVKITDSQFIQKLKSRIEKINSNGDKMIEFSGDAENIQLKWSCGGHTEVVEIYNKNFKTPSTGFNTAADLDIEKPIYQDIDAILFPSLDKILPRVQNLEYKIGDFTIKYAGEVFSDGAPTTASANTDTFIIKDSHSKEIKANVTSGQLPPQPFSFELNKKSYVLLTYQTQKKVRLYADYFQVIKK